MTVNSSRLSPHQLHTLSGKIPDAGTNAEGNHAHTVHPYFRLRAVGHNPRRRAAAEMLATDQVPLRWRKFMKKSILLAALLAAAAALAGCAHPQDITDDVAFAGAFATRA
jgi:predicted small secreted protein